MGSLYVSDLGSNTAPYDTKAKAANLLLTAVGAMAAGDTVYVLQAHNQARSASAQTITVPGTRAAPGRIICITGASAEGSETDADRAFMTNTISTNTGVGITINCGSSNGVVYVYGLNLQSGTSTASSSIVIGSTATDGFIFCENCNFDLGNTNATSRITFGIDTATQQTIDQFFLMRNCSYNLRSTSQAMTPVNGTLIWEGNGRAILLSGSSVPSSLCAIGNRPRRVILRDLDASNLTSGSVISTYSGGSAYCELRRIVTGKAAVTSVAQPAAPSAITIVDRVGVAGTNNWQYQSYAWGGRIDANATVVRTGGAVGGDGTTKISWRFTGNTDATLFAPFRSGELTRWNTSTGSKTLTIYGIANQAAIPTNAEVYVTVDYSVSGANPGGALANSTFAGIINPSASNLAADTSTWDSGVTARANSTAYVVGDIIKTASNPGRVFFCTTSGTSAGAEPASPGYNTAVDGGSVTDGTAVFRAGWRFTTTVTFNQAVVGRFSAFLNIVKASGDMYFDPYLGALA